MKFTTFIKFRRLQWAWHVIRVEEECNMEATHVYSGNSFSFIDNKTSEKQENKCLCCIE